MVYRVEEKTSKYKTKNKHTFKCMWDHQRPVNLIEIPGTWFLANIA